MSFEADGRSGDGQCIVRRTSSSMSENAASVHGFVFASLTVDRGVYEKQDKSRGSDAFCENSFDYCQRSTSSYFDSFG